MVQIEYHDIGKIVNWDALGLINPDGSEAHEFEQCLSPEWGIQFDKPTWQAIIRKDEFRDKRLTDSIDWALSSIADHIAAGYSRGGKFRAVRANGYYCLWTGIQKTDLRLNSVQSLKDLIEHLNNSPSWAETKKKYRDYLITRAEEATSGLNVTTLLSHSTISGKLARIIEKIPDLGIKPEHEWKKDIEGAHILQQHQPLCVFEIRIYIIQRPYRISDWNVFAQRRQLINSLLEQFNDNILTFSGNRCFGVAVDEQSFNDIVNTIQDNGFGVEAMTKRYQIASIPGKGLANIELGDWQHKYSQEPPLAITIPICETCQMAYADKIWQSENVQEHLCSKCFSIRQNATKLHKLASWETGAVGWVNIKINFDYLKPALTALWVDYIKLCYPKDKTLEEEKINATLPIIADFLNDFDRFLAEFQHEIIAKFGADEVESVDKDLWCVHFTGSANPIELLQIYERLFRIYFPKLVSADFAMQCPINFSFSVSSIKHPFFEHWRFFEKSDGEVNIRTTSGFARIEIKHLGEILSVINHVKKHGLHRLREIANTSNALATLVMSNNEDRDKEFYIEINKVLPEKIDFKSLFVLSNLKE